jgi:hypothetical protein
MEAESRAAKRLFQNSRPDLSGPLDPEGDKAGIGTKAIHEGRTFRIVGVQNDQSVRLQVIEQLGLRLAVMDRVVMVVEVILRNVRDDGCVELRAGDPILIEGVAGDFECRILRVAGHHRAQPVGEHFGIGRRHVGRGRVDAVVIFDGAQQSGAMT